MENQINVNQEQVKEMNDQFKEFLQTKGIKAKFKLAFENMKESTQQQHEKDVKSFNEIKQKSIEENKDFVEFLHTKGLKAKIKLVIENIKKGAREVNDKTKAQIEASKKLSTSDYSADALTREFKEFLKQKGLDSKYIVTIEEIGE